MRSLNNRHWSGVATADDIHTPVENAKNRHDNEDRSEGKGGKPPGQFVSDELEEQTARFLEEVSRLARRRRETEAKKKNGPPPPSGGQRSSRL